jgi:ATP-dependent 26S proteasome regulatory subunit
MPELLPPPKKKENKNQTEFEMMSGADYPLLDDVFCSKDMKTELEDIVLSMSNSVLYRALGVKPDKTYMFSGQPGTGKTFTMKAIRNELVYETQGRTAFIEYNIGDIGTAYINMGSRNLQTIFDRGVELLMNKEKYSFTHTLYWFDECDVIMSQRGGMHSHKEDDKLLETLMKNLQNINDRNLNEYVFFSTNFVESLDKASIRSGRIDRHIKFNLPDLETRKELFKGYINLSNTRAGYQVIRGYNIDNLAKGSEGFSCADIESVVSYALKTKIKKELRNKPKGIIPAYYIQQKQLMDSLYTKQESRLDKKKMIGFCDK